MSKWNDRFFAMVDLVASWSEDPSSKIGCVIVSPDCVVLSTGYNGYVRGITPRPELEERPRKYYYYEHAERNAVYNAAAKGISIQDAIAYMNTPPCADCARALIQSQLDRIIVRDVMNADRWMRSCTEGLEMMREANIGVMQNNYYVDLSSLIPMRWKYIEEKGL